MIAVVPGSELGLIAVTIEGYVVTARCNHCNVEARSEDASTAQRTDFCLSHESWCLVLAALNLINSKIPGVPKDRLRDSVRAAQDAIAAKRGH
jgi:hypothetical protein